MANVAKDLAQLISQSKSNKTGPYDTQATVKRVEGNTVWVSIPGGVDETPIDKTVNCSAGDKVQVRVSGGRAWITGNASAPPTDDKTANEAKTKAVVAETTAIDAKETADAVEGIAQAAQQSANTAATAAAQAVLDAGKAKTSADNASEYAARALGNLSTVQSVAETLTWITAHGTMALTSDVTPDPTHVYFVVDAGGDYTVGGVTYAIVTEPVTADMGTYYELSIDESLNNYVGTHLALDGEGLWLLPASAGTNKVLIATGAGSTYTTAGTYLIDATGEVIGKFTANSAQIGKNNEAQVEVTQYAFSATDKEGDAFFIAEDLRNEAGGVYTVTDTFISDGVTTNINLTYRATNTTYTVTVDGGDPPASMVKTQTQIVFGIVPQAGAVIVATYQTASQYAKAYTLGIRASNSVKGGMSTAEGQDCVASGRYSHAEGHGSQSTGVASHAEGVSSQATGTNSHAEGSNTQATSNGSHAEGLYTEANGYGSHSEGQYCKAILDDDHAEGLNCVASGGSSHAEGAGSVASERWAHAQNLHSIANQWGQTALGTYNEADTTPVSAVHPNGYTDFGHYAVIVGNGSSDDARSNALTVDWSGNVKSSGDIEDGSGNVLSDKADTSAVPTKTSDLTNDSGFVSGLITEEKSIKDNVTVNGSGTKYTDGNASVAKTGYTPLGVVGFRVINASSSGANGANVAVNHAYISGTTAYFRVKNTESATAKVRIYFTILYAKS